MKDGKKREQYIKELDSFNNKYFNDDQKTIIKTILELVPEKEIDAYARFLFMKRSVGFGFDYSPEIAKGRIVLLDEDKKRGINVQDEVTTDENKLIIGNNYNALQSLLCTHKKKIDVIYIDPYNTEKAIEAGNFPSNGIKTKNKWQYKDKFGRTGWLKMMKDLLDKAKELLSEDGIIFVSMDDTEQAYLKQLMDDIFGETNFVSNIIWKKSGGAGDAKQISNCHEYILCYAYCKEFHGPEKNSSKYKKTDKYEKERGKFIYQDIFHPKRTWYNGLDFPVYVTDDNKILLEKPDEGDYKIVYAGSNTWTLNEKKADWKRRQNNANVSDIRWTWSKKTWQKAIDLDFLEVIRNGEDKIRIAKKIYEKVQYDAKNQKIVKAKNYKILASVIDKIKIRSNGNYKKIAVSSATGSKDIEKLFTRVVFSFPKPVMLIKLLLRCHPKKNAAVLDFFAGSGTTGHAVLELNREDGGKRKFILCVNNENNIAHSVTYERLYRIIKGKGTNGETDFKWLEKNKSFTDTKLRVLDITTTNIQTNTKNIDGVIKKAETGLKLLSNEYTNKGLDLYYDLAALNPLKEKGGK